MTNFVNSRQIHKFHHLVNRPLTMAYNERETNAILLFKLLSVEFAVSRSAITVDNVQPLYGPVTGGTRVTITGQLLSVSTVKAVYIGQYRLYPKTHRLCLHVHCLQITYHIRQLRVIVGHNHRTSQKVTIIRLRCNEIC